VATLPEDVLYIHYPELASSSEERLQILGLISTLLNKIPNSYTAEELALDEREWETINDWIAQGHGSYFWDLKPQSIQIKRMCEKHVLIGTNQLLTDLQHVTINKALSAKQKALDDIWSIARKYIATELH
jgi:hypothetical protein